MKYSLPVLGMILAAASGCSMFGGDRDLRAVEWTNSGTAPETVVFGPISYDEMKDFVLQKELQGWRTSSCDSAGPFLPGRYLIVMERPLE